MKAFKTGLIVGKFCPIHKGHEYLIDTALERCEQLVIISYAKPGYARCARETRMAWLTDLYPQATCLVVDDDWFTQNNIQGEYTQLPHDDAPEDIHRRFTSWLCRDILDVRIDVVFTSEDYGDGFARVLSEYQGATAVHICVDKARKTVPISGTKIRQNQAHYRAYLSGNVYASLVKRAVFLGGESTGKSTLAEMLAAKLQTQFAPEYGRELWEQQDGKLAFEDMLKIAQVQIRREEKLSRISGEWLFCDTSPLTTLFYSQSMFGKAERKLIKFSERTYDAIFLCYPDFEFVQDGTRQNSSFRDVQHGWYETELNRRGVSYTVLKGSVDERVGTVIQALKL